MYANRGFCELIVKTRYKLEPKKTSIDWHIPIPIWQVPNSCIGNFLPLKAHCITPTPFATLPPLNNSRFFLPTQLVEQPL